MMASRKELKDSYKQMKFRIGVYQIRNSVNGKIFVDSSVNLDAIWNRNRVQLKFGSHPNEEMQKEWNEMGEESFHYEIISELVQKDGETTDYGKEVKQLERLFLEELQPYGEKGYNIKSKT